MQASHRHSEASALREGSAFSLPPLCWRSNVLTANRNHLGVAMDYHFTLDHKTPNQCGMRQVHTLNPRPLLRSIPLLEDLFTGLDSEPSGGLLSAPAPSELPSLLMELSPPEPTPSGGSTGSVGARVQAEARAPPPASGSFGGGGGSLGNGGDGGRPAEARSQPPPSGALPAVSGGAGADGRRKKKITRRVGYGREDAEDAPPPATAVAAASRGGPSSTQGGVRILFFSHFPEGVKLIAKKW